LNAPRDLVFQRFPNLICDHSQGVDASLFSGQRATEKAGTLVVPVLKTHQYSDGNSMVVALRSASVSPQSFSPLASV